MGDFAVDIFQETLKELITSSKLSLIIEEKHQLQSLEDEIKYLKGFLKVAEKKRSNHSKIMILVMQIRDLISKAENIIEQFVVHAFKADYLPIKKKKKQKENNKQVHRRLSIDLESVKKEMKTLTARVNKIYDKNMYDINGEQLKHSSTESGGSSRWSRTSKAVKEKVVVGFKEEVEKLVEKLDGGEDKPLEIISIIGAGGGGKTTLARKVYDHPFTLYTFEIRAWINVSQDYDKSKKRNLLIQILESVIPKNYEDYKEHSDDKLGEDILKCLKGRRYLIVMDDIWGVDAWNDIHRSFPKEFKRSKVLFTSRLVVQLDGVSHVPHYLAPLPEIWCWELLQKKVFGMKCCPPELVDIGKQIAKKCKGLPLAVVTIAGILATEEKTLDVWEKVAKHLSSIIAKNQEGCMEILELSYIHLPLHLKACFLYIGGYPEDKEIPVRELIWLWIAEGFIQRSDGRESLETIAKDYLIDLTNRSLVQVAVKGPLGGIKACRIHDLLRELCLKKAEDDNFLVKVYGDDSFSPSATNKHRRLFIADKFFKKLSLRPRNLRSFMCISLENKLPSELETYLNYLSFPSLKPSKATSYLSSLENILTSKVATYLSFFEENFELLRVLNLTSVRCSGHIGLGHLVHLRYLSFASFNNLLTPFSYLLNLETLNLKPQSEGATICLPRDIFKMVKLRHLYTKRGKFTFHHSSEEAGRIRFDRSSNLDSLQTLHKLCACETCRSFLVRTPNLRKLGLYGREIPEDNVLMFLTCLETLSVTIDCKSNQYERRTLPSGLSLPLTITRITLRKTHLKWEELSILQTLPSLEVLRLMDYACCGPVWNTSELDGFPQLKYLRFYDLTLWEWIAFEDQFPKLEVLVLQDCMHLEQIPMAFAYLNDLREIKLQRCRMSVEESAKKIKEEQRRRVGDDDCLNIIQCREHEVLLRLNFPT